jgi:autotransporter translocation and assembly factor TamB
MRMKRVVLGLLLLVLCGVAASLWLGAAFLNERLRLRLEHEITRALGSPARIQQLTLSALPIGVDLRGLVVGEEKPVAQVGRASVRLLALASLAELRPVLEVRVESVTLDTTQLPAQGEARGAPAGGGVPPLHLKTVEVGPAELRFPMGNTSATLTLARVSGHAETGLPRGHLSFAVDLAGVELRRKSYQVAIDQIYADGGADAGGLFVHAASVKGDGIAVSVSPTARRHRHVVAAAFDPSRLGIIVDELSFIGGQARVDGILSGDLADPGLDAILVIQQAAIADRMLGDLQTHVTRSGARLGFEDLHLASTKGQVSGSVELIIDKEVPIRGDLHWQGVDLEGLLATIGTYVPFTNQLDATTSLRGALDPLDLDVAGAGTLHARASPPRRVAEWDIRGRVRPHDLQARLELTQPERNRVSVTFLLDDPALGGSVTLGVGDLAALSAVLPRPVHSLALTGQAEGSAAFSGTTEHPAFGGSVTLKDLTVMGTVVPRVSGDFAIAASQLATRSTRIDTAAGNAQLSGTMALDEAAQNEWQLSLRELNTDLVLGLVRGFSGVQTPLSGGTLSGTVRCHGPWRQTGVQGVLNARSLRVGREPLDRVDMKVAVSLPRWSVEMNAVHAKSETMSVRAAGQNWVPLELAVDSSPTNLARWRGASRRRLVGTAAVHGRLSGPPSQAGGWLELTAHGLGARGRQVGDVTLRAEGERGEWTVRGQALANAVSLSGTLRSAGSLPYTLGVSWREPDLTALVAAGPALEVITSGELSLAGTLRQLGSPSGALNCSRFEVSSEGYHVSAPEPIRVEVHDGHFRIGTLVMEGEGSRVSVAGEWTTAGHVSMEVRANSDLALLELLGPPVYSARGQVTAVGRLLREPEIGWDLDGQVSLRDAALDADLPVTATDTNGNLVLKGSAVRIERLTGRAGGGEFSLSGSVDVNRGPAVTWSVKDVGLSMPEWLEERVSGQGQITGSWKAMTVRGEIEVLNALYDRRIELTDLLPFFREQLAPAPRAEPEGREVRLDLHLSAPDGVFVDNNFAKAEMRADLRVGGSTAAPVLTGIIEFVDGEVTFRKRTFTITAGSIDFRDPFKINPVLNISAESQISTSDGEYVVTVVVSGTAENPRVQFSADDPSLSQNDILSLVTAGKTTAQLQREGGGVSVTDVLALVPTRPVEQPFENLLRVDSFEITPVADRDTGAIEPRVTIGKNITDRLRAQAATSVGVNAQPRVQVEYRFTRRFSVLGTWGSDTKSEAGAFGGDIKYRYEFRRLPFTLLSGETSMLQQGDAR